MLTIGLVAAFIAVVAGFLGFGGVAQGAASVAKIAFGIFFLIAILAFGFVLFSGALLF
jgi:uncharacterized membrane protein YtjA (UPF0391 family)